MNEIIKTKVFPPLRYRLPLLNHNSQNKVFLSLIFFFPIFTATVKHAGSTLYALLTLVSLFYFREGMRLLSSKEKRFLLAFVTFFFLSSLSLVITEDLRIGVARLERYARFLAIITIYCMLRVKKVETGKTFLIGILIASFTMFTQAYYQVNILHAPWAFGAYNRIIMGSSAVLFSTLLFISSLFYRRKWRYAVLSGLGGGFGLYVGLVSECRTAWLFLPIVIIYLSLLYQKRLNRKNWKILIYSIAIIVLFTGITQKDRLKRGLKGLSVTENTFSSEATTGTVGVRLVMWRNSLLIFKDSPIFGTGMGDFMHDSIILLEKGLSYKNDFAVHSTNAHNIYFMLLAEGGLVGLSLLVFALFILPYQFVYGLWKKTSDKLLHFYTILAMISLFAFAWFGVSESWVNRNTIINLYCVTFLVFVSSAANRAEEINEI